MSDRNGYVSTSVLQLTALHRIRAHDAPIRRRTLLNFKKFLMLDDFFSAAPRRRVCCVPNDVARAGPRASLIKGYP